MALFTPFSDLDIKGLKRIFEEIQKPILMYRVIDLNLTTVEVKANHLLGRLPVGYIIVKRSAGETVFGDFDSKTLNLTATGDVSVRVLVF